LGRRPSKAREGVSRLLVGFDSTLFPPASPDPPTLPSLEDRWPRRVLQESPSPELGIRADGRCDLGGAVAAPWPPQQVARFPKRSHRHRTGKGGRIGVLMSWHGHGQAGITAASLRLSYSQYAAVPVVYCRHRTEQPGRKDKSGSHAEPRFGHWVGKAGLRRDYFILELISNTVPRRLTSGAFYRLVWWHPGIGSGRLDAELWGNVRAGRRKNGSCIYESSQILPVPLSGPVETAEVSYAKCFVFSPCDERVAEGTYTAPPTQVTTRIDRSYGRRDACWPVDASAHWTSGNSDPAPLPCG